MAERTPQPFQAERSLSSLHSFLNSSSTPPTPTPVRNGSPTFLRHGKQLGTANAARLGRSASFASKVPEFGSLLDTSAESPRISHVGRKSITTGRWYMLVICWRKTDYMDLQGLWIRDCWRNFWTLQTDRIFNFDVV